MNKMEKLTVYSASSEELMAAEILLELKYGRNRIQPRSNETAAPPPPKHVFTAPATATVPVRVQEVATQTDEQNLSCACRRSVFGGCDIKHLQESDDEYTDDSEDVNGNVVAAALKDKRSSARATGRVSARAPLASVDNTMVYLGEGRACVPASVMRKIDWSSHTNATRKLLTAVFSRRVLATHSLSGRPSPAFPNRPVKKQLDPGLVDDIISTIMDRCDVKECEVRTSITTKCSDESKMYRARTTSERSRDY